jgi:hypothetical protein
MAGPEETFRDRLDRSTRRALLVGGGVLIVTLFVEVLRAG